MRIALLADIHANREALEAVLKRIKAYGYDHIGLLGDIVGYGPDPEFCIEVAARIVNDGGFAILGNHDDAINGEDRHMNPVAKQSIDWTRDRLGPLHREFLRTLPDKKELNECLFVHASANKPKNWEYIRGEEEVKRSLMATYARVTIVGHVHVPYLWQLEMNGVISGYVPTVEVEIPLSLTKMWLGVLGSVGQPRDGNCAASFAIIDLKKRTIIFSRASYNNLYTAHKIREEKLPEVLAKRILRGI